MLRAFPKNYRIRLIYRAQTKEDIESAKVLESLLDNLSVILCYESQESIKKIVPSSKKGLAQRILHFPSRVSWKLLLQYDNWINNDALKSRSSQIDKVIHPEHIRLPISAYGEVSGPVLKAIQSNLEWADLVQADFVDLITLSCLSLNNKPKVYVAYQVHTSYVNTFFRSRVPTPQNNVLVEYHSQTTRLIERIFLQNFDGIIVFSQEDRHELEKIGVDRPVLVSPYTFPLDINPVDPSSLSYEDWKGELVFIGSGDHGPNEDGLQWFLEKVYPKLHEYRLNGGRPPLMVVGKWSLEQQLNFQEDQVRFVGFVDNLSEAIQGKICICPIRIGAGLRTKLLSAAICSSPIVTTTLGCQGIGMEHDVHCLIADDSSEFAAQLVRLLSNIATMAPMLASNANQLVKTNFSQETVSKDRLSFYESLVNVNTCP